MNRLLAFYARCMRKLRDPLAMQKYTAEKRGETYSCRDAHSTSISIEMRVLVSTVFMVFSRVHARASPSVWRIITGTRENPLDRAFKK